MYQRCPDLETRGLSSFLPALCFSNFLSFRASALNSNKKSHERPTSLLLSSPFAGHSAELIMRRSLPPGDYLVPLFIGDRQGLTQKQTVHVRICSCPSGSDCEEHSEPGLLWWALSPVCAAVMALSGERFRELSPFHRPEDNRTC